MVAGVGEGVIPLSIILEDGEDCACGGLATSPNHRNSLLHLQWSWLVRNRK